MTRSLSVGSEILHFPTFLPVTTFGGRFPLDEIARPYLNRIFPATMVSYHYAKQMHKKPPGILFIDSGGFASLFDGSQSIDRGEFVDIETKEGDLISPPDVLAFQEKHADIGATVDFVIPPDCPEDEALSRQEATIKNAIWAIRNRGNNDFRLYASIQAWDIKSAQSIIQRLAPYPFDGFALGGMVPRIRTPEVIETIIQAIRDIEHDRPLHVFGVGQPDLVRKLISHGVDSIDSSSYVRAAADGKWLNPITRGWHSTEQLASDNATCDCVICSRLSQKYLTLEGESNRMALALHNLYSLRGIIFTQFSKSSSNSSTSS
jgi:tRNA-guanine family transglycosylase